MPHEILWLYGEEQMISLPDPDHLLYPGGPGAIPPGSHPGQGGDSPYGGGGSGGYGGGAPGGSGAGGGGGTGDPVIPGGGGGDPSPPLPPYISDFTLTCERERVIVAGAEVIRYTVHCTITAVGIPSEPSSYAWTATGGTPNSGTGNTFTTVYTDPASKSIVLLITGIDGKTATNTENVPAATSSSWKERRLYLAGKGKAEASTAAGAWNLDAQNAGADVLVVSNGPIWGAAATAMRSSDLLATSASESTPKAGANVTALWVETDLSATKILAGLSDGSVYVSTDSGATWSSCGSPEASSILRVVINRYSASQYFALTANGLYDTVDGGTTWATLVAAAAGETFRDVVNAHTRIVVVMSGGRLACALDGVAFTFPVLSPVVSDVVAVASDIVRDRFVCYDHLGRTFVQDADGRVFVAGTALPAGGTVQTRGLWRDGAIRHLYYFVKGTGGAYKTLDNFSTYYQIRSPGVGTSPAAADYRQIGADGVLTQAAIAPATMYSGLPAKILNLWDGVSSDGSVNNPEPANWYASTFNDTAWAAAVAADYIGDTVGPPVAGSTAIWHAARPTHKYESILIRQTVTLGAGLISSATLTYRNDDGSDGVWINGTFIQGSIIARGTGTQVVLTIDPAILIPGGTNVIAIHGLTQNSTQPPGAWDWAWTSWKLEVS